jgi:cysteine desulfurase
VAAAIGARPDEVYFPASGTQAIHLGVAAVAGRIRHSRTGGEGWGPGAVASAVEHSAVLHAIRAGYGTDRTTEVAVDTTGRVDPNEFVAHAAGASLACLQLGNHEVGTVQPVAEVAAGLAGRPAPALLVDAAAAVGRLSVPSGWSILTASAHKWGGPPGVGVLAIRRGTRIRAPLPEDERGWGLVPGYENVPAALAAAAALRARLDEAAQVNRRHVELVDHIRRAVPRRVPDVQVVGHPEDRLPHIVTFSCLYVEGEALLSELDRQGFAVSSGSSCTSSTLRPSHVLEAMGVLSHGNVRVSLARDTTREEVDRFLDALPAIVTAVRHSLGAEGI